MLRVTLLGLCLCGILAVDVGTQYGKVRGHKVIVNNTRVNTTVDVFYGVRFANDTSGALRFKSPVPPDPWGDDVFIADTLAPACPQFGLDSLYSEDCLHVNIYSPDVTAGPYPVMIWIHGGAYIFGSNSGFAGHFLASHGIIVVTVNYRLNTFGFAYTGSDACPGNAGLWDQRAGIEFVKDNIANFGGDPNRITISGESAGAGSVSLHVVSPESKDLFQQAIMESGAETGFWNLNPPDSHPEDQIRGVAEQVDCDLPDDYDMMECLRGLPWQDIQGARISCGPGYICAGMVPVVDGVFLPKMPGDLREDGNINTGPILAGFNRHDGALFLPILLAGAPMFCCTREEFIGVLINRIGRLFAPRLTNTTAINSFFALDYQYSPWPYRNNTLNNRHALIEMLTHAMFGEPWDKQVKHHSKINSTFTYLFNYRSAKSTTPDWAGVTHAMEIAYVFGDPMLSFNEEVREDSGLGSGNFDPIDLEYSLFIQDLFVNFIKYGNPTPQPVANPLGGSTQWPPYALEDENTMNLLHLGNTSIHLETTWDQKAYAFYNDYLVPDILQFTTDIAYDKDARTKQVDPEELKKILDRTIPWPASEPHVIDHHVIEHSNM